MTLAELRTAVKQEARVKVGVDLNAMIDTVAQEILRDYGNKARYREVYSIDVPIVMVDEQSTYPLPVDFQHLASLRFSDAGTLFRPIYEFTEGQLRTSDIGYPRYYQLCADGIMLFPSSQILASNTCFLSYYKDPSSLFTTDADEFPIPRIEPAVKKATIARVIRFMQNFPEYKLVKGEEAESFSASQGGQ